MQYDVRPSARNVRWSFRLTEEHLEVDRDGDTRRIPFAEIRRVQLGFAGAGRLRCRVVPTTGAPVVLVSHEYLSLNRFENRLESMVRFVGALHERLSPHADRVRFVWGWASLYRVCVVSLIVLAALIVLMGWALAAGEVDVSEGVIILITAVFLGLFTWALRNGHKPTTYEPGEVTSKLTLEQD